MISYNEAKEIITESLRKLETGSAQVPLLSSLNRISFEDIYSDSDMPGFNNSSMDGIAVKYERDLNEWNIIGEVSAGNYSEIRLADPADAVYITTGAMLPADFDTVIPIENILVEGNFAKLNSASRFTKGQFIRSKGEDLKSGSLIIAANTKIGPRQISLASAFGITALRVRDKFRIGVLATGDELVEIESELTADKVRCSNTYGLMAAIENMNMTAVNLGIVKDNRESMERAIKSALNEDIDILITTGGVSAGKYDHLVSIFEQTGVDIKFAGVNIRPGKPMMFGIFEKDGRKKLVFGLPGNPVSALVCFELFVKNTIENVFGRKEIYYAPAILSSDIRKNDNKRHFIRGKLFSSDGVNHVSASGSGTSADLYGLARANCLIVIEEERTDPKKGESVRCMMI